MAYSEDDFYGDLIGYVHNSAILGADGVEEAIAQMEYFIEESLWDDAEEIIRDHFGA